MPQAQEALKQKRDLERTTLLMSLDTILQTPMVILSFIMLGLFLVELSLTLSPDWRRTINLVQWFIWVAFVLEFGLKFTIAPGKLSFLRENWLMALAVALPVLRVFQAVRAARAVRSLGALRVITVGNRSIRQLGHLLGRRKLQYVLTVVAIVTILGAAGVFFLERSIPGANIRTFGGALWWSAGTITTVGTELYPVSAEGRVLAVVMMIFGVSVFGYIAGTLASLFIHVDQQSDAEEQAATAPETGECPPQLLEEIKELQEQVAQLTELQARRRIDLR